jgi:D-sedoheptulose 7-phosphate isomerase
VGNPLSSMGDFNFHVGSNVYGLVEVLHHSLCHCVLDNILLIQGKIKREDVFGQ